MTLRYPLALLLILVVPAMVYLYKRYIRTPGMRFSSISVFSGMPVTFKTRLSRNIIFIRGISVILLIAALARPQSITQETWIESEGIEIALALDVSTSMLAEDFKVGMNRRNRFDVIKDVVKDFIRGRKGDRIGIVIFGSVPYMLCPLTLDYGWLSENLDRARVGMVEDGTAIGSGIMAALKRLKDTQSKSKVIILLTDGRNNSGMVSPMTSAEAAAALGVRIYTIGAGGIGPVPYPVPDNFGGTTYQYVSIDLDEQTLKDISAKTNGRYFRATDTASLKNIYAEIDRLEKTKIEEKGYLEYRELFPYLLIPGLILLMVEALLEGVILRRIP